MDPTAYDLVRRSILATEPMAVRDMVAILQIAAEWLQRHPEAQYRTSDTPTTTVHWPADPLVDQDGVHVNEPGATGVGMIAWNGPAGSLPAPFVLADDPPRKETWLDRWLKRRAAKGPE
jgi:hypothetical protein